MLSEECGAVPLPVVEGGLALDDGVPGTPRHRPDGLLVLATSLHLSARQEVLGSKRLTIVTISVGEGAVVHSQGPGEEGRGREVIYCSSVL